MDIKYQFQNLGQVEAIAKNAPVIFQKNMVIAAKVSTRDVQKTARATHTFRSKSGFTELAIETQVRTTGTGVEGRVFLNEAVSPWGRYLHEGTGLYGPRKTPYVILPKKRKWLRFPVGSEFRFAKMVVHPGIKGDPFVYNAGEANQNNINKIFNRYADRASLEVSR